MKVSSSAFFLIFPVLCLVVAIGAYLLYLIQGSVCESNINTSLNAHDNNLHGGKCDDTTVMQTQATTTSEPTFKVLGDGICDDNVNTEFYGYDMGDCCDATSSRDLCEECQCTIETIIKNSSQTHRQLNIKNCYSFVARKLLDSSLSG